MTSRFSHTALRLSDDELKSRIEHRKKYLPETIEASIAELQQRGHTFTSDELSAIEQDIKTQRDNAAIGGGGSSGFFNNRYKYHIVEDPDAPILYSRRAVYIFTIFLGAFFGSIMMAVNCIKIKNTRGVVWILLFGVVFTALQIVGANYANVGSSYYYLCGLIAGVGIDLFWNPLIGKAVFYKAKPIWIPLIIGVFLLALVILLFVAGQEHA